MVAEHPVRRSRPPLANEDLSFPVDSFQIGSKRVVPLTTPSRQDGENIAGQFGTS
jgi:hypothetical protein